MPTRYFLVSWTILKLLATAQQKTFNAASSSVSRKFMSKKIAELNGFVGFVFHFRIWCFNLVRSSLNRFLLQISLKLCELSGQRFNSMRRKFLEMAANNHVSRMWVIKNDKFTSVRGQKCEEKTHQHPVVRKPIKYGFSTFRSWPDHLKFIQQEWVAHDTFPWYGIAYNVCETFHPSCFAPRNEK